MKAICIIPARYASTRFPGKVLVEIDGKTMLQRVYEMAKIAIQDVFITTNDERIMKEMYHTNPILSNEYHFCGTNRCAEAVDILEEMYIDNVYGIVVNLQADMPVFRPYILVQLLNAFGDPNVNIATLIYDTGKIAEPNDLNEVKVLLDHEDNAMYFSRQPISRFKHIGVYAYRRHVLDHIATLPQKNFEDLEQNAWLYYRWKIKCIEVKDDVISINVLEDLLKLKKE